MLVAVTSCEQEQLTQKPHLQVPTGHNTFLNAVLTLNEQLPSPVFDKLGFQKDESTGNYTVDSVLFAQAMSDGSFFDEFLVEDFDNIIEGSTDFNWFIKYLEGNSPVEPEKAEKDLKGRRWWCCTVCCPSLVYKASKKRRKWGARLWCTFRQMFHSAAEQNWCSKSLKERSCLPSDGCQ